MAKFKDSAANVDVLPPEAPAAAPKAELPPDRSIGDIIAELRHLTADQRDNGLRFGEAAVALGLATRDDVLYALAQQFHYPYSPDEQRKVSPELVMLREPFSPRAEAFRALRSQVTMRLPAGGERAALAVISADSGDGKTYLAANLALGLAQLGGGRTLLVDANLRNPRQHELFGLANRTGLSGILSGRSDSQVIQQVAGVPSLFVLPVGTTPPNPLELVERPAFSVLMRELASKFDHVVVDTPAAVHGADAAVVAARCGAALLVARRGATRIDQARDLVESFAGSAVRMAGVVYNEF
jgi:protein-tyrosine kinase